MEAYFQLRFFRDKTHTRRNKVFFTDKLWLPDYLSRQPREVCLRLYNKNEESERVHWSELLPPTTFSVCFTITWHIKRKA